MARFCFFFQAEDGIRDRDVTGVQTCALPISQADQQPGSHDNCAFEPAYYRFHLLVRFAIILPECVPAKIGRASCRERV